VADAQFRLKFALKVKHALR